jgi:hypothetical protein
MTKNVDLARLPTDMNIKTLGRGTKPLQLTQVVWTLKKHYIQSDVTVRWWFVEAFKHSVMIDDEMSLFLLRNANNLKFRRRQCTARFRTL